MWLRHGSHCPSTGDLSSAIEAPWVAVYPGKVGDASAIGIASTFVPPTEVKIPLASPLSSDDNRIPDLYGARVAFNLSLAGKGNCAKGSS